MKFAALITLLALTGPPAEAPARAGVAVSIEGQTAFLVGERAVFRLEESGEVSSRTWTMLPAGTAGLRIYESGNQADFVARTPGSYVLLVAIAGKDGSVAQSFHTFELQSSVPQPQEAADDQGAAQPAAAAKAPDQIIRDFTAAINAPRKAADLAQIRSALTMVAGQIDSGAIALQPGGDMIGPAMTKMRNQAQMGLGGNLGPWQPWFRDMELLLRELERAGGVQGPQSISAATRRVVAILEGK